MLSVKAEVLLNNCPRGIMNQEMSVDKFLFQRKVLSHTPFVSKSFGLYLICLCSYYRIFAQLTDTVISAT